MEKLRAYARSVPITFESWIISFFGIVLIRMFFEQFSNFRPGEFIMINTSAIVHAGIFYLVTILVLMVILVLFTKIRIREIFVICIFGFFIIWIAPIIDLMVGGVGGHLASYLFLPWEELLLRFATFFGGHIASGVTLGIQIETMLGIIFCYLYVYLTTKNIPRAFGAAVVFYCFIFFILSIPSLIALFITQQNGVPVSVAQSIISSHIIENNISPNFTATNLGLLDLAFDKTMVGINTILAILATLSLFFLEAQKKVMALMKNGRPERVFHFFLLFMLGSALPHTTFFTSWVDVQSYILAFVAFVCAWMFSVCQNDIHDETIDTISNKDRPLVTEKLSRNDLEMASKIFLLFAFFSAYAVSHYVLFFVSMFLLVYFIYSNPPLRLKRFVILNSFLVSLACLSVVMAGFFLINPNKIITAFPFGLVLAIIIFFTIVSNIRDIKDAEGDRADGIKTIPVLLGVKRAKKLIAGGIVLFFFLVPSYFHLPFLIIPSIIASLLSWYFINEKNYKEWKAFVVYMIYLMFIIGAIILK